MSCEGWERTKLGDVLAPKGYIRGPFGSSLRRGELKNTGIPVYEQQHAIYGSRDFRFYIDDEKYKELKRFTVEQGDLIISCSGTIGKVSMISENDPKGIISQALLILRCNPNIADRNYLYQYLSSKQGYQSITSRSSGSVQVNIAQRGIIENIPLFLPPISEQKVIADTLSCLDDKIELNNRINKTLEEMAQAIFKSWFVDFEPFQDGEFVDSELGPIPKGWRVVTLGDLCQLVTKGTTPTTLNKQFANKGVNFIKAESIMPNHNFDTTKFAFIDDQTNKILSRSIINENDILFTIAGTLGRFAYTTSSIIPANTNQAVAIIRADEKKISPIILFSYFVGGWHKEFYEKNIQQAVQANLSLTTIKNLPFLLPSKKILPFYEDLIAPLFQIILNNNNQDHRLIELRNALLPKLMSDEIEV